MPTQYIRGANRTAQWYQDDYPGAVFSRLDKFLLHTTETMGWPGYGGGASAPNATYYPRWRQLRQHFGINRSARALRDPSNTAVRENRDNVFQLEIICYSDYSLARRIGGLWVGDLTASHMRDIAAIILQCHRDWDLPLSSTVRWREGRQGYYNDVRLSGSQFDAYRGILGHVHASGNTHWDPGGFRYSRLENALGWQFANHPVYGGGVDFPDPTVPDIPDFLEEDMTPEQADALGEIHFDVKQLRNRQRVHHGILTTLAAIVPGLDQEVWEHTNARNLMAAMARVDSALAASTLAEELAPLLPTGQAATKENIEAALREVFGELDETDAPA